MMLFMLFMAFSNANASLAIQKITNDNIGTINSTESVVLGDKLFFIIDNKLSISDGTNQGTHLLKIASNDLDDYVDDLYLFNDQVIYTMGAQIWSTDGVISSTISELMLVSGDLTVQDNLIFARVFDTEDNSFFLMVHDGENELLLKDLDFPDVHKTCVLGENNYLVSTFSNENGIRVQQYNNGTITDIFVHSSEQRLPAYIGSINNGCYYKSSTQLLKVGFTGEISAVTGPDELEIPRLYHWLFDGRLFGLIGTEVYELNEAKQRFELLQDVISDTEYPNFAHYVSALRTTDEYIYFQLRMSTTFPEAPIGIIYDTNFNLVKRLTFGDIGGGIIPSAYSVGSKEYLVSARSDEVILGHIGYTNESRYIETKGITVRSITGNEDNVFVFGKSKGVTNQTGLYVITDKPLVSENLQGLWVSDQWQDQGLVISSGKRKDASEYIFVSFYLYRDGQPFWVAGSRDIILGEQSITIELSEFTGSSFIEGEQADSTRSIFAQMTIEPTGCHNISAVIQPVVGDAINLNMRRIGNENIAGCVD